MHSASRIDTLHEHCCYLVFQGAFEFIKRKIIHRSAQNPAEFSNFESMFRLGIGAKTNSTRK